ncbi:TetR/AcrR family transcriptional regulator [Antrihabitans sp. YC2-6]|nr:TetR/AcrR family transcriptional regulator [Antrihabitans sp. YC2-6]
MRNAGELDEPPIDRKRVTKRRAETRQRLLGAAFDVFAADGFGRSTVEQICERAGYTRGAFYSNFDTLDDLFLAMWEDRSAEMLAGVDSALDAGSDADVRTVRDVVARVLQAVPIDDNWYRISAEFTAHALRNPPLRHMVAARESAIVSTLTPMVEALLLRAGRTVPDPAALGQALVAVHDGTTVQCLIEPDNPAVHVRRIDLFTEVVLAYSSTSNAKAAPTEGMP